MPPTTLSGDWGHSLYYILLRLGIRRIAYIIRHYGGNTRSGQIPYFTGFPDGTVVGRKIANPSHQRLIVSTAGVHTMIRSI